MALSKPGHPFYPLICTKSLTREETKQLGRVWDNVFAEAGLVVDCYTIHPCVSKLNENIHLTKPLIETAYNQPAWLVDYILNCPQGGHVHRLGELPIYFLAAVVKRKLNRLIH